jgi:hypothetical protein
MNDYRSVRLFIKLGPLLAIVAAAVFWIVALWAVMQGVVGWPGAVLGAIAGLVVGFLVMVFVDLTKLIADMLLPR